MRLIRYSAIMLLLLVMNFLSQATVPDRKGWWKFDASSNLTKAETGFGSDLVLVGKQAAATGPESGNGAVQIGPGSYYKMTHAIPPAGTSTMVNEYALQFDFKINNTGVWHSFFQTSVNNNTDGDFFINPTGNIGVAAVGYSSSTVKANEWYRLIISVKNGSEFKCYLDGNLILTGSIQAKDGRFSLDQQLLVFADDDGEDGDIYCAELGVWNQTLNADQVKELGGFGHDVQPSLMTRIPYLQGAGISTMNICWHDTSKTGTKVEYGLDMTLDKVTAGSSELISDPFRWHTVKLSGLSPNTRYFYRVSSGNGVSASYSFKTLPDLTYSGKLRFLIFSDTHASDTTMAGKVFRSAKAKVRELYGSELENQVNGIFHSGDIVVSGNVPGQYTTQFFQPISALSPNIPTMVTAGNHEGESPYYYGYMKFDDQSAYPNLPGLHEKIWQMKVGNSLFIGLNTNIVSQYGMAQSNWLDARLNEAEQDKSIDFVFLFMHHPPFSELWFDVSTFDVGANYVKNTLFPVIKKYTKVQELHSGHTHGFERGTILSGKADGDFRIVIGGGGGGPLDNWGDFTNFDYSNIQIAYDHFCFQILEIDVAKHSFQNSMYSLGNQFKSRDSELLDSWYKKTDQGRAATPLVENAFFTNEYLQIKISEFNGTDSVMSVEFQVMKNSEQNQMVLDSLVHWKNIYGVDNKFNPIDKNPGVNLAQLQIATQLLSAENSYQLRVRYRDHNLKWTDWSNSVPMFKSGTINSANLPENSTINDRLYQNSPNPFRTKTMISYTLADRTSVLLRIYNKNGQLVDEINEGIKPKGSYHLEYKADQLKSGLYFYELITGKFVVAKKMLKID